MSGNSSEQIPRIHWYSLALPRGLQITVWVSIITVLVLSFLDLTGWIFDITLFKSILPQWAPMKIMTAICFIFTVAALVIIHLDFPAIFKKILPGILATFICLVSLIIIYVYLYSIRTGQESALTGVSYLKFFLLSTQRMAFLGACNFLLISLILFLLSADKTKTSGIAHVLTIPVTFVSYFVTVSYILDVYSANELKEIAVALNSGIAFLGVCTAVLLMRPDTWFLTVFTSPKTGGIIARKLLPTLMILPVIIGWLRINGERAGMFKSEEGVVLVAISYTVCFVVLVWRTASSVDKIDKKRRLMEDALRESEDRFRTIAESLPVQISITSIIDSTVSFTNEAYEKTFGLKRGELIGRKAHNFYFYPEDRLKVIETLKEKGSFENLETRVKKSDGSSFWIISSIRTITFGGEPAYLSAFMDITERKKAQDELIQLNRTLNAHSKSSHSMMHSGNELHYLNEVCKIIIEDCGHAMVWIGYAQNDKKKSVKPVAYYGFDEGYIKNLDITWDDTERGRGPTGTAIRTGKPAICINMQTDPAFKPWREEAIKRGYESSLVLPLISDNKSFGAISIYSKEPDGFSDNEIILLSDLANDLAYGVSYIRLTESEREAVNAIKESEEKFKFIATNTPDHILMQDAALRYNFVVNPQLGLTEDNMLGKTDFDILSKKDAIYITKIKKRVLKTGEPEYVKAPLVSSNGELQYFEGVYVAKHNKQDQIDGIIGYFRNVTEAKLITDTQEFLLQCGLPGSGENFFDSLARYLSQSLGMDYVCIDRLEGDGLTAQTVAIYNNGKFDMNTSYTLKETPCGQVVGKNICCFPENVCQLFPNDSALQDLKAVSYIGTTLWSFDGKPIGLIAIIGREQLKNPNLAETVLKLVAVRAAGELERKLVEDALLESTENLLSVLNATKESVYMFDSEGKFTITNATGLRRMDKTDEKELIGHHFSEFMSAELAGKRQTKLDGVFRNGKPLEFEDERDGFVFHHNFYPVIKDKEVSKVVTYSTDITEHKKAEKELQSTKNYLENLINYANAPIIVWNPDAEIQLFNHAFEHLTGYSSAEVEGKKLDMLFPKDSLEESNAKIINALTKNWETIEIPILTKKKEIRTVLWNSANIYDPDNKTLISTMAQGNDITERIKAELEVSKSKEKLDLALDSGNIGIWEWDIPTDEFEWDERMGRIFGTGNKPSKHTFKDFEKHIYEDDVLHFRKVIQRTIEEDFPFELIYRIKRNKGEISYISTKASLEKNDEGAPVKMIGVCFDITEMKKGTEQTLFRLNEELKRSNKELEQFAYVASHDLQEPLRMVSSFTQLLSMRYKDKLDHEAQEFIKYAVDGASRMQSLINDLLEYSRVETRGKELSITDMHEVLGHAINNLSIKIREKNALVSNDELPTIFADGGQMVQLFQNLIGNGIKFCNTSPRIHISAKEEKDHYLFSVKDNGIGIEPQYFDKIFQIFQRLHSKEEYGGTGIGLAICKRIVDRHDGKIWVVSKPGEGTIFKFTVRKR